MVEPGELTSVTPTPPLLNILPMGTAREGGVTRPPPTAPAPYHDVFTYFTFIY